MPEENSNRPPIPAASVPPPSAEVKTPAPDPTAVDPKKLTPEEQMALYEKDLKENDWGHQPC